MYKLVVVDDEELVRSGLRTCIDWGKHGIEFAGEAEDGEEALKIIEKEKPDLVVTDVCMPEMDGLELTGKIMELVPSARVILLSGYDDFNYVQAAIRNRAFDYILKPVEADILVDILLKAVKSIEADASRLKDEELLRKGFKESIPIIKEYCIDYVLTTRMSLETVKVLYPYVGFNVESQNTVVMVIGLDMSGNTDSIESLQVKLSGMKQLAGDLIFEVFCGEITESYPHAITVVLNYHEDIPQVMISLHNVGLVIIEKIHELFGLTVTVGIGRFYNNAAGIPESFKEAVEALEYGMLFKKSQVVFYTDIVVEPKTVAFLYPFELEEKILLSIKAGDTESVNNLITEFIGYFLGMKGISPDMFKNVVFQLIYVVLRKLTEWNISLNILQNYKEPFETRIKKAVSYTEVQIILKGFVTFVAMSICEKKNSENNFVVQKACKFMQKNLSDDIGLSDIASSVYLTPNYFAVLFKKETGRTVLEHLTQLRMKRAGELLLEKKLRNREIADFTGYRDVRYFIKTFKKYFGKTPSEYRLSDIK